MDAHRISQTLTLAGITGVVVFGLLAQNAFGTVLSVATTVASGVVQYGRDKPFIVPLFAILAGLLLLVEAWSGQAAAVILGLVLGLGLPFLAYRLASRPR